MPDGGDVDGDQRLLQPVLQGREDVDAGQVGAALDDGVDVIAVDSFHRIDHLLDGGLGDRGRGGAVEAGDVLHLEADLVEEAAHVVVAHRRVGRDDGDALGFEQLERVAAGGGAGGQAQVADLVLDVLLEGDVAFHAAPEGLGGHAEHQVRDLRRQHVLDAQRHLAAHHFEEALEHGVLVLAGLH